MKQFLEEVRKNNINPLRVTKKNNTEDGLNEQLATKDKITRLLKSAYQSAGSDNEKATIMNSIRRELRDGTDIYLKKLNTYHNAQYHQFDLEENTVLEHTIPLDQLCASWFKDELTFHEMIRMPTCRIGKRQDKKLAVRAKDKNTYLEYPFRRYIGIVEQIVRKDGKIIDPMEYSIYDHNDYFINGV
jgi:type IV secretory pathway VirB4 component